MELKYTSCLVGELDTDIIANQIVGKWKLTRTELYDRINDHSDENVIYNFQSNGILLVSGGGNIGGYRDGEYSYVFKKDYLSNYPGPNDILIWLVKIDGMKWTYGSQKKLMTLGTSYVDGSDLCFQSK